MLSLVCQSGATVVGDHVTTATQLARGNPEVSEGCLAARAYGTKYGKVDRTRGSANKEQFEWPWKQCVCTI